MTHGQITHSHLKGSSEFDWPKHTKSVFSSFHLFLTSWKEASSKGLGLRTGVHAGDCLGLKDDGEHLMASKRTLCFFRIFCSPSKCVGGPTAAVKNSKKTKGPL